MFKKNLFVVILLGLFIFNISFAYGVVILPPATGDATCRSGDTAVNDATYCGNYTVNDFMVLAINISKWILGIVGSLALIMFIYGGFMFLISAGSADKVTQAKKIIVAAVIGLLIVFTSWLIIKFVMGSMGLNWNGGINTPTTTTAIISNTPTT